MNKEFETNGTQNNLVQKAEWISKLFASISIVVGTLVLSGWIFNIQLLKSILPGLVSMKANTAIGFIFLGLSLILNQNKRHTGFYTRIFTGLVLLLGLLTLSQYLFNINLEIDQLIFIDNTSAALTSNPGRMSPVTAVMFVLLSTALILFQSRFGHRTAQVITLFAITIGFVSFMGYAHSITTLFQFYTYTAMALYTAILFILLGLSILFSKPHVGLMTILLSRNVGSVMVRRILPVAILTPFLMGYAHVNSQYFKLLPLGLAEIILDIINVTLFSTLILWLANSLNKVDIKRVQGKEELIKQNSTLTAVMNNSHSIIIFLLDNNYRYVAFNDNHKREMKKVYNVDIELGMNILDSITILEVKEKAKASIDRVLAGETFIETEIQPNVNIYYEFHWNMVRKEGEVIGTSCFVIDLTERKRTEAALQESEEQFHRFFDEDLAGDFKSTPDGKLLMCNNAFVKILGCKSIEQVLQMNVNKFYIDQSDRNEFLNNLKEKGRLELYEETLRGCDGRIINVIENVIGKYDEKGELVEIFGYMFDITDRKKAEEQILLLSSAVENSPITIMLTDAEGNIEYVNRRFIELTGYTFEEVKGKNPRILKSGEKSKEEYKELWETIKSGKVWRGEFRNKKKNGELYWELATIAQIKKDKIFYLAVKEDITERKRTEEKIMLLANAIESVSECVTITDNEDKILFTNKAFRVTYGYNENELIGKEISIVRSQSYDYKITQKILPKTKDGGWQGEVMNRKKDGTDFPIYLSTAIIKNEKGNPIALIGVASDITQTILTREELIKAREKAEQSDKLKSEFLAQMSHEIRTPINIMFGNIDYLKELFAEKMDTDAIDCFEGIDLSSKRIVRTIDLILNVAELQTSGYNPNFINIDINSEVLERLFSEHQLFAKQKGIDFIYICKEKNTKVLADHYSITQIFANLIDNAIKYTKKGKIEIFLTDNEKKEIVVEIKDTGIGMSKEFLAKMFEPFVQEDKGYTRSYDGNGLGLALVKKYCEINNAIIEVESEKGIGSIFRVIFKN